MTDAANSKLDPAVFDEMIALHGADLSRWPLETVKPALALMAGDDRCRARFEAMRGLDDDLRLSDDALYRRLRARHGDTCPKLQENVMRALRGEDVPATVPPAAVVAATRAPASAFSFKALFAPGGSLLVIGMIGFMMGFQQPASADDSLLDGLLHGQEIVITNEPAALAGEM
jgi:hypothetical protein